jgi:hypothetical protein
MYKMNKNLFKLAGMTHKQGYYSPEIWERKTGINPLDFPGYIEVTKSGLCLWTNKAEREYKAHNQAVTINWQAIGTTNS